MSDYTYFANQNLLPSRLDKILVTLTGFSRSKIQQMIESGKVQVGTEIILTSNFKITTPCEIKLLEETKEKTDSLTAKEIPLNIIYEDDDLLVINKQAGLTVHPGAGNYDDTLVNALLFHYQDKLSSLNGPERPGIVHRLDRDTTGLMVVAKNDTAHQSLAKQIENKTAIRCYIALAWGMLKNIRGEIRTNIGRSNKDRTKMTTLEYGGKEAITHYQCLEIFENGLFSLVECQLETGRTHQIRVHMSHIGHSVVGDQIYGTNDRKTKQIIDLRLREAILNFKRQALHAYKLSFDHPTSGKRMEFEIDLPNDMKNLIQAIREKS